MSRLSRLPETLLLAITLAFLLAPPAIVVLFSFDSRGYIGNFPPPSLSLRWYDQFLTSEIYISSLITSLILGSSTVVLSLLISIPTAYFLTRYSIRGRNIVSSIFMSPLIVPGTVTGVALLFFFVRLGLRASLPNLLIAHLVVTFPFALRTLIGALSEFDPSLEEAAMNLGASRLYAFLRVTLPIAKPAIVASAIFVFAMSFDEVPVSIFLTDPFATTFPVTIFSLMRASTDLTIAAASTFFAVINVVFILLLSKTIGLQKLVGLR